MNRQNEVKDIVPDLLNKIESTYKDLVENDEVLSSLLKKNADKLAKAQDEQDFAAKIAERLSEAYKEHISSGNLPNGKMYYNIAKRIIPPTMTDSYQQISDYCYAAQSALNENAGISIKAQRAPINTDRIDGIVNRVSQEPFDEIDWILKAPIENFCRSVVDDHKKANADFHYRSGLRPRIIRKTDGKCCKWCSNLAGAYEYSPGMDREVFRRHENCGCTVEYDPGDGSKRRQNVWSKEWKQKSEKASDSIALESPLGNKPVLVTDQAIRKVKAVKVQGLEEDSEILQEEHQKLLKFAQKENGSKEVTGVINKSELGVKKFVYAKGDWDRTNLDSNPEIPMIFAMSPPESLVVIHNHPNSNSFSYADLGIFSYPQVKTLTLVTNKGVVRVLNKTDSFDYREFIDIIKEEKERWGFTGTTQPVIVKNVLKRAKECNLEYIK